MDVTRAKGLTHVVFLGPVTFCSRRSQLEPNTRRPLGVWLGFFGGRYSIQEIQIPSKEEEGGPKLAGVGIATKVGLHSLSCPRQSTFWTKTHQFGYLARGVSKMAPPKASLKHICSRKIAYTSRRSLTPGFLPRPNMYRFLHLV